MSESKYYDDNFAQSFKGTKQEFRAAYKARMKQKYGSFWVTIAWFIIQNIITYYWNKYHENQNVAIPESTDNPKS